jgi:molecular chaperone GrpE (heat shock protein)
MKLSKPKSLKEVKENLKKIVNNKEVEKVEPVEPTFDPNIPENKQRWLR